MTKPWLIICDFNSLLYRDDKYKGRLVGNSFDEFVDQIGLGTTLHLGK